MSEYKTSAEIGEMTPEQRMAYLLEQWSMSRPTIIGVIKRREDGGWWIEEVRDASGNRLVFPIADRDLSCRAVLIVRSSSRIDRGSFPLKEGQIASATIQLAPTDIQEKRQNPLLINARFDTVRALPRIPSEIARRLEDGSIDIDETFFRAYVSLNEPHLVMRFREEEKRVADLEDVARELQASIAEVATQTDATKNELSVLVQQVDEATAERDRILAEIEADCEDERRAAEAALVTEKAALADDLALATELQTVELERLRAELDAARLAQAEEELRLMNQNERLREYVRERADRLLALEFISQEQYAELRGTDRSGRDERTADWPTLADLDGGYAGVVSHMQRYLYGKNCVYPQVLLRTFHALMLTGDFVILAGLSGSGKTMLVKSFAEATGNVTHIIPVKPNWTSAEDLTGYYNPLQRSYLTTPFLAAIIAAQRDPERLHIICLDEMNLARVEYYFADFLSALEERSKEPTIDLYSDDEAGHVRTEFKLFVDILLEAGAGKNMQGLGDFLKHREIAQMLKERLGIEDGESMLQMHARLRRMIAGVLTVPSQLRIPWNVRFVGTVNMDATTHYLSPKVLDRAHVIQFQSPLNYWKLVADEVKSDGCPQTGVRIPATEFPRNVYPPFDPDGSDEVSRVLRGWSQDYFNPLGIDVGMRLIRQASAYREQWLRLISREQSQDKLDSFVLNHLLRQKLLPRFSFDSKQRARGGKETIAEVVERFYKDVAERLPEGGLFRARAELESLIERAQANDGIFNYWS